MTFGRFRKGGSRWPAAGGKKWVFFRRKLGKSPNHLRPGVKKFGGKSSVSSGCGENSPMPDSRNNVIHLHKVCETRHTLFLLLHLVLFVVPASIISTVRFRRTYLESFKRAPQFFCLWLESSFVWRFSTNLPCFFFIDKRLGIREFKLSWYLCFTPKPNWPVPDEIMF